MSDTYVYFGTHEPKKVLFESDFEFPTTGTPLEAATNILSQITPFEQAKPDILWLTTNMQFPSDTTVCHK